MNYESDKYRIATWQVESVKATFGPNQYLISTDFVINGGDVNISTGLPPLAPSGGNNVAVLYTSGFPQIFQYWYGLYLPSTDLAGNPVTWGPGNLNGLRFTSVTNSNLWFQADFALGGDYGYYKFYYILGGSAAKSGFGNTEIAAAFGSQNIVQWGPYVPSPQNGFLINQTPLPFQFDNYTYVIEQSGIYVCNVNVLLNVNGTYVIPPGIALYINNIETNWVNSAIFSDKGTNYQLNFNKSLNLGDTIQIRYKCDPSTAWAVFGMYSTIQTFEISLVN